jgi:hypothetical protein
MIQLNGETYNTQFYFEISTPLSQYFIEQLDRMDTEMIILHLHEELT